LTSGRYEQIQQSPKVDARKTFAIIMELFYWKWLFPLIVLIFAVAFGTSQGYNLKPGTELRPFFYVIKWVTPPTMHTSSTVSSSVYHQFF